MRLINLITGDIRTQFKYGFYFIYAVFCALYVILLFMFPESWRESAASIMIYSDPSALGLFFMGTIVLLEKSQRVLNAIAVSPVRVSEYIASKVISLMLISVLTSVIIAICAGFDNIFSVAMSTALTSAIFTIMGLIAASGINNLNQYLLVTAPLEAICIIPPVIFIFAPASVARWFPLSRSIDILLNMNKNLFPDSVVLLITAVILYIAAHNTTSKMWKSLGGVKL